MQKKNQLHLKKFVFDFKHPIKTSRGSMSNKESWFLLYKENQEIFLGECGFFPSLSLDKTQNYQAKVNQLNGLDFLQPTDKIRKLLLDSPALLCGYEMLLADYENRQTTISNKNINKNIDHFKNQKIIINGLVWMGDFNHSKKQIDQLLDQEFHCIKIKIGSLNFDEEIKLIEYTRKKKPDITIRLDANGAYNLNNINEKLQRLKPYNIHSIEQPVEKAPLLWSFKKRNDYYQRVFLQLIVNQGVKKIPIAVDEELIGLHKIKEKEALLEHLQPDYLVLKPSLLGGFKSCQEWIKLVEEKKDRKIGWWITSALESNLGLASIAQWTYKQIKGNTNKLAQGLGTGNLYQNNFFSPHTLKGDVLSLNQNDYPTLKKNVWETLMHS